MENWKVTDIRWANLRDLNLPFWKKWNEKNPLPRGFWQIIWEYPYLCSKIPSRARILDIGGTYPDILFKNFPNSHSVDNRDLNNLNHPLHQGKWPKDRLIIADAANVPVENNTFDYVFSISAIEEMPHTFDVLKDMIRIAKYRVLVTLDVSDKLGLPIVKLRELEKFLNVEIPLIPSDALHSNHKILKQFHQKTNTEYDHIRVLGFTIDARDSPKSIGIIIPHWNSWHFLKACLENIQKYKNPTLKETIYVIDDTSDDGSFEKAKDYFKNDASIQFHQVVRPSKKDDADVGYLLDFGIGLVKEQYIAMIDADIMPISTDWLSFPIWLQEKYNCSSVGLDTGLSSCYIHRIRGQNWWQPQEGYFTHGGLYDNQWFSCTNNLYRVMNNALAKVVSESIGFTRDCPNKSNIFNKIYRKGKDILKLSILNKRYPYFPGCEDNGVAANQFIDINAFGPKFNIPLTGYIGLTPSDGTFGQNISGLIFHFALSTRALSDERREVADAGKDYYYWVNRIQQDFDDQLISELIDASRPFRDSWYSPLVGASWYKQEFLYIEELCSMYHQEVNIKDVDEKIIH